MQTLSIWRSTSLRVGLGFAATFVVAGVILIIFLGAATVSSLNSWINSAIRTDAALLQYTYRTEGLDGLERMVRARVASITPGDRIYLLTNQASVPIAGTLSAWKPAVTEAVDWQDFEIRDGGASNTFRIHYLILPDGQRLIIGRNIAEIVQLQALIVKAGVWSVAVAIGLAMVLGLLARHLFLSNLRTIRVTADTIAHGNVSHRITLTGNNDEFDLLAGTLNDMLSRIEELVAGVRNVSNAVAHDLRTPLAELRTRLEAIQHCDGAPSPVTDGIEEAIADVDRLITIFTALLRLVDIDSGVRRAMFAPVDLGMIAVDAGELYSALAETKDITLTVEMPAAPMLILGDRDLISQALSNLLDNALKFTPTGGAVSIRVTTSDAATIDLVVADSGPGIPLHDLPKVTARFYRGDTSRHAPGTGLGLSLVKAVADLHHAELGLYSSVGLVVRLRFPFLTFTGKPDNHH